MRVPPSPTGGRHVIGHFVVPLIFGALAEALPDRVQADSGMLNLINVQGTHARRPRHIEHLLRVRRLSARSQASTARRRPRLRRT